MTAPLEERIKYARHLVSDDEILARLDNATACLDAINDSDLNTSVDLDDDAASITTTVNEALAACISDAMHDGGRNPYKEFFEDCVRAMEDRGEGNWPGAEVSDPALRAAIIDLINGDYQPSC